MHSYQYLQAARRGQLGESAAQAAAEQHYRLRFGHLDRAAEQRELDEAARKRQEDVERRQQQAKEQEEEEARAQQVACVFTRLFDSFSFLCVV